MNMCILEIRRSYFCLLICCTLVATQALQEKEQQDLLHGTVKRSADGGIRSSQLDHLSKETKRQQGWFSGFGKRSADDPKRNQGFYSGFGKRHRTLNGGASENYIDPELYKKSQAWYSSFGKRDLDPLWSKRAQGWFSGFGKRTPSSDSYNNVQRFDKLGLEKKNQFFHSGFGKRSQRWFSGFGKRDLISDEQKRNQGWYSGFGKKSQAWFSGFGKRNMGGAEDDIAKRGQGWYSGFGKRDNMDLTSLFSPKGEIPKGYASHQPFFVNSKEDVPNIFAETTGAA